MIKPQFGTDSWTSPYSGWSLAVAAAVPFWVGILTSIWPTFLLLAVIPGAIWIAWGAGILLAAGWDIFRRCWRRAGTKALLLFVVASALLIYRVGMFAGWIGHLGLCYPIYKSDISRDKEPDASKLLTWEWGGYLIFNVIYLVYDASDTLRLEPDREPKPFRDKLLARTVGENWWKPDHLIGHFYIVTTTG